MPVTVQIPGFQNHAAPIQGIASLADALSSIHARSKQNDLVEAETQQHQAAATQAQAESQRNTDTIKAMGTPGTFESENAKRNVGLGLQTLVRTGIVKKEDVSPMFSALNDPKITGLQVQQSFQSSPLYSKLADIIGAHEKALGMKPIADARMAGVENQKDRIAAQAADHFDKDSILTKINKQKQQIETDKHTLDGANGRLTPSIINEVQQGIANAISGGGSAGLGKTEQVEIQNVNQKIAQLKQKFESGVQYVDDPELINYFHGVLDRLGQAYDKNAFQRASQIFNGRSKGYKSNPAAVQVMQDKLESYRPGQTEAPAGSSGPGGAMSFEDFMKSRGK